MSAVRPLRAVTSGTPRSRGNTPVVRNVVGMVRIALRRENRLASILGSILGGFVPLATYTLAHTEVSTVLDPRAAIVAGGLLYSGLTVYRWGKLAFADMAKAIGFVVLTEGVMILGRTQWLGLTALAILIGVNAVATAVTLTRGDKS